MSNTSAENLFQDCSEEKAEKLKMIMEQLVGNLDSELSS